MEVPAADESEPVPTVTEIEHMHQAEEDEQAEKKVSDIAAKKDAEVKAAKPDESKVEATTDSKPTPADDKKLESKPTETKVASETEVAGDKKPEPKADPKSSLKSDKREPEPKKEDATKADVKKAEEGPAKTPAPPPAESDSDSDSDIIVTSSEPMTIEKLTASMNLSRSVSGASAATTSSKKYVRFSEGTKGSSQESVVTPPELPKKEAKLEQPPDEEDDAESQYPNPYVAGFDRTGFLRKRLYGRRDKWTTTTPVSIRIATYNVNDRVPPSGTKELGPLVGHGQDDIIVVGLQEADLRSSSMLVAQGGDRAAAWEEAIFNDFGDNRDLYERVELVQYVGVALFVFARSKIRTEIRRCETSARGIGLLGFGGNKAGVAARMKIYDTTVCFVCSRELQPPRA